MIYFHILVTKRTLVYNIQEITPEQLSNIKNTPASGLLVMTSAGEFLLMRRRSDAKYYPAHWSVPSGEVDSENLESMEMCARREFEEETTAKIPENEKLHCFDRYFAEDRIYFLFVYKTDKKMFIKINPEHDKFGWFKKEDLPTPLTPQLLDAIGRI